jgi:hypothetical protein
MAYRLRYQAHDLELAPGEFVIGRSTECQLSLDDPLVSRKHAVLRIRKDGVSVQDLGSRNGVIVNGTKADGVRELAAGDKVSIGGQEMTLLVGDESDAARAALEDNYRRATQTLGAAHVSDLRAAAEMIDLPTTEMSRSLQSFRLLGGVADKAFAMNRAEEAERILNALLTDILQRARDKQVIDGVVVETAARYAARLAGATTKGSWFDYCVELYALQGRPAPASVVDELYTVVRRTKSVDVARFRAYLADLRAAAAAYGPAERFLVQRIEGLERLVSLK